MVCSAAVRAVRARPNGHRLRAGTALIAHGEFSIVVVGLVGAQHPSVGSLVVAYVFALAVTGPVLTRLAGDPPCSCGPKNLTRPPRQYDVAGAQPMGPAFQVVF